MSTSAQPAAETSGFTHPGTTHPGSRGTTVQGDAQERFTLVPPRRAGASTPTFDAGQLSVVGADPGHGALLVLGAPGTGKSTVAVHTALRRVTSGAARAEDVLVIGASRQLAATMRDEFSAGLRTTLQVNPVRTFSSYAFDVLRRAHAEKLEGIDLGVPSLISGPEQDAMLADILSGHAAGTVPGPRWPQELALALGTRGFRQELRELFDRVSEYGLLPQDLAQLGRDCAKPEWVAAAAVYGEYLDVVQLRSPGSYDPSGLIRAAINVFTDHPDFLAAERARLKLVVVDDVQECTRSMGELLALVATGDLVMTAAPDVAVQGFRGARPDLVQTLGAQLGAQQVLLSTSYRLPEGHVLAWNRVTDRIALAGSPAYRSVEAVAAQPAVTPTVTSAVVASAAQQWRFFGEQILEFNVMQSVGFSDMALILPSGALVAEAGRHLLGAGIPVRTPQAEIPLNHEPAVRALMAAYRAALDPAALEGESATVLLTSRIGGMSTVQLRRLRQRLRTEDAAAGLAGRSSDEQLVAALLAPAQLATLGLEGRMAARTSHMIAAGHHASLTPGATAQTVLWAVWDAANLAEQWARTAVSDSPNAGTADRDLDALMGLFQAAERHVERFPGAAPRAFDDFVSNQDLPMDSLAARGMSAEAVSILTPAAAAGRQWPVVLIGGLQEGTWPNVRLRGQLLGSSYLVDVLENGAAAANELSAGERISAIRYDELRNFASAMSRSSAVLLCVGSDGEDERPSGFLEVVDPWEGTEDARPRARVGRPKNLRQLVAEARRSAESPVSRPADGLRGPVQNATSQEAAQVLGILARHGIQAAHPRQWWGLLPLSTTEPAFLPGQLVPIGPSSLEKITNSPLNWLVDTAQGALPSESAQQLGTLIHELAQHYTELHHEDLRSELDLRWPELNLPKGWNSQVTRARAAKMIKFLAEYGEQVRTAGRKVIGAEDRFAVRIDGPVPVILRGSVDRLERAANGALVIADFKTGASAPSDADVPDHMQLGAYQAAILHGAFVEAGTTPGGALLVNVGKDVVKLNTSVQEPLTAEADQFTPAIAYAGEAISAADFLSIHNPQAKGFAKCQVPEICPLCSGRQVTE